MPGAFTDPGEKVVRMSGVERTHYAVMKTMKRNWSVASARLRDVSRPLAFLQERKALGERITFVALVIRAVAKSLSKQPRLGWMARGWRLVHPSTADIGCSVGTESPVSPVVVIRDAANKGLREVNDELFKLAEAARAREAEELAKIERLARLIPIGFLFRIAIWFLMTRQRFIRQTVGNFQVTVVNQSGLDLGVTSMTAVTTLLVGRIKDHAMVENGQVVVRPGAYFCLHFDHALHGARDGVQFQ
jgi:pyruvate/2-oxoglutarate dehydrogenase complex dihydrolipoamide acyltransferase (E2) component